MSPSTATQSPARRRDPRNFVAIDAVRRDDAFDATDADAFGGHAASTHDGCEFRQRSRVRRDRGGCTCDDSDANTSRSTSRSIPQPRANPTRPGGEEITVRRRSRGTRIAFERVSRALASPRVSSRRDLSSRSYVECRPRHPGIPDRPERHRDVARRLAFHLRDRVARWRPDRNSPSRNARRHSRRLSFPLVVFDGFARERVERRVRRVEPCDAATATRTSSTKLRRAELLPALRVTVSNLSHDDHDGIRRGIVGDERGDAARAETTGARVCDDAFDVLRRDVAPADDDEIFRATDQEEFAVAEETLVACSKIRPGRDGSSAGRNHERRRRTRPRLRRASRRIRARHRVRLRLRRRRRPNVGIRTRRNRSVSTPRRRIHRAPRAASHGPPPRASPRRTARRSSRREPCSNRPRRATRRRLVRVRATLCESSRTPRRRRTRTRRTPPDRTPRRARSDETRAVRTRARRWLTCPAARAPTR